MMELAPPQEIVPMTSTAPLKPSPTGQTVAAPQNLDHTDPLTAQHLYVNATSRLQIVRIENLRDWYFERVVFPGQRLFIEAKPDAVLDVYTGAMASAVLEAKIACETLETVWL
jgi:hypothetical protein